MRIVLFALLVAAAAAEAQRWRSERCGPRFWPRTLTFAADAGFTAVDEVAPCPAGAQCKWSGIDEYAGTWVEKAGGRTLTVTGGHHRGSLPTRFALNAAGAPVETYDGGSCVFAPMR